MKKLFLIISIVALINNAFSQIVPGNLEMVKISSSAIKGNIFGDSEMQDVAVYLPPSYYTNSAKKYPVLYFLPGYYDIVSYWTTTGAFQGFKLKENMDKLINEGAMKEMIVVIPNSYTFLEGSFYANSKVNRNWGDFYTNELIKYIDTTYRVLNTKDSRGIAGHSMGGSGALDLSMKNPDLFCMGYGICSGLFAPNWVEESPLFYDTAQIQRFLVLEQELKAFSREEAHAKYVQKMKDIEWLERFMYAYGSAFAGDSTINAPYINFPFYKENNQFKIDSSKLEIWEEGFGNLKEKIEKYKHNLTQLKAYVLDYGSNDNFKYIISGNKYYHELLDSAGIAHSFINNGGTHESAVCKQIETSIMPLCSKTFVFDTANLDQEARIITANIDKQVVSTVIDEVNKTITIKVGEKANLAALQPIIQTSLGATLLPKSRSKVDFSNGPVKFTVISENEKNTETWEINVIKTPTKVQSLNQNELNIFPNPAGKTLNFSLSSKSIINIEIYNAFGQKVMSQLCKENHIDIYALKSGFYTVKAEMERGVIFYGKFVKE